MGVFELISEGMGVLFQLNTIVLLVIGLVAGIIAGALPGFTSTNATAVMLPFTLGMSTHGALIFIAGVYAGAMYGDAVPSLLFKAPGSPGAAATIFDGYPMAQQGKADQALGISVGASCVGAMVASLIVIFIIRPMANVALQFGPAEMFLLAMLGISVISSVSRDVIKGLQTGLFGLLVAAMAADPIWAQPRMNFGRIELFDEVPFIPVLIGLFAIPTLVELTQRKKIADDIGEIDQSGSFKNLWEGVITALKRPIAVIRSGIIGCFVGAIPGSGASIATFVSYGQAQAWSKDRSTFGKGNPDGIIASEAANNGVTGGGMVPTLALGIPGSGTTAVLLSVLILHGITPGPAVVRETPELVYGVLTSLFFGAILLLPIALIFNRFASNITLVNTAYIIPILLCTILIGSYAIRLYTFDFYVVMIFGLLGMLMNRTNYPVVPFVLGVILGPIAEGNVIRALEISSGSMSIFFGSYICVILWLLIIIVLFLPYVLPLIREKAKKA